VTVIDDDLGRSGSGVSRPGFERLLAAICEGRVGAVFAIEASRLARNGRDWHTLIEFCGLVGTVMVEEDGVYEPRHPNDRLLPGMEGYTRSGSLGGHFSGCAQCLALIRRS
jgi:DNA invertase Pin-like site-specific DNA recombinase